MRVWLAVESLDEGLGCAVFRVAAVKTGDRAAQRLAIGVVGAALAWVWIATCCSAAARAENVADQLRELQKIVRRLEQENKDLRNRLSIVEQRLADGSKPAKPAKGQPNADPGKLAWRQLQIGMTADDVRSLLGEPEKVTVIPPLVFWDYPRPKDSFRAPNVSFKADGMTVHAWEEP